MSKKARDDDQVRREPVAWIYHYTDSDGDMKVCTSLRDPKVIHEHELHRLSNIQPLTHAQVADALLDALMELADLVDHMRAGNYTPDSFTTQPARTVITYAKAHGIGHGWGRQSREQDTEAGGPWSGPAWLGAAAARVLALPEVAARHLREYAAMLDAQAREKPVAVPDDVAADAARWRYAMDWNTTEFAVCKRVGRTGACWDPIKTSGPLDRAMRAAAPKGGA